MPRKAIYGYHRGVIPVDILNLTGTVAKEFLTDLVPGFAFTVEKVGYGITAAHTGAGGSQIIRVVKGASTVVASTAIVLAAAGTLGAIIDVPITAAAADFHEDDDTLTVDMTAGGTAFTAGSGVLYIAYRALPQKAA